MFSSLFMMYLMMLINVRGLIIIKDKPSAKPSDNSILLRMLNDTELHRVHEWQAECNSGVSSKLQCYDCGCTPSGTPIECKKIPCPFKSFLQTRSHRMKFDMTMCNENGRQLTCEECSCEANKAGTKCRPVICPPLKGDFLEAPAEPLIVDLRMADFEDTEADYRGEWFEKCGPGIPEVMQCAECKCEDNHWDCTKATCPSFAPYRSLETYKKPECSSKTYFHCEECWCVREEPELCEPIVCPPLASSYPLYHDQTFK